ncbi:hypothetical protein [Mesorhizobium comanense]|uniref:hypothetical protein n=1 Tax=Mesorhizobium comanense TaxID=2502215 RepID=UPI0010F73869|nr:hypothetical protein [Mesorhizobium comanense]
MTTAIIEVNVCAAPHLPAGILSPYGDGEKVAVIDGFASRQRCKVGAEVAASPFLPVSIRGEMSGRTMRGGAGGDRNIPQRNLHRIVLGQHA